MDKMNEQKDVAIKDNEKELANQIAVLETIAKKYLDRNANMRYGALKLAHPEIAIKAISTIAQLVHLGKLKGPLTDKEFKNLLLQLNNLDKNYK